MIENVLFFYESTELLRKIDSLAVEKGKECELKNEFKNNIYEILKVLKKLKFVDVKKTDYHVTRKGKTILFKPSPDEQLKAFVSYFINKLHPAYADLIRSGRKKAEIFLPNYLRQILSETKIFSSLQTFHEFAESLKKPIRVYEDCRKKEIGTYGEKLSIAYEKKRVKKEPKWVAAEDDGAGYDLESFLKPNYRNSLFIEVKTTTMPLENGAIYISRNEWETAKTKWNCYLFHIWVIKVSKTKPYIFKPKQIAKHVPKDGEQGLWCDFRIKVKSLLSNE